MALETTRQKTERLFTPQTLERIEKAGLMVVDKQDFQLTMATYGQMVDQNRALRLEIQQLRQQLQGRLL